MASNVVSHRVNLTPTTCRCCDSPIKISAPVLPHKFEGTSKTMWGHKLCVTILNQTTADSLPMPRSVCRHWKRSGSCGYEDKCFFSHDEAFRGLPTRSVIHPPSSASFASPASPTSPPPPRKRRPGGRPHLRNKSRAFVLRKFVMDKFPPSCLLGTVIDVAGGKGELAFEFTNLTPNGKNSTILIDPRTCDLRKYRRKWDYGLYWRNPVFTSRYNQAVFLESSDPSDLELSNRMAAIEDPFHLRAYFEVSLFDWAKQPRSPADGAFFDGLVDRAKNECWTNKGLRSIKTIETDTKAPWANPTPACDSESDPEDEHAGDCYGSDDDDETLGSLSTLNIANICSCSNSRSVSDAETASKLLSNATLLIGMHPDQAAGEIAQVGLKHNIPFAIVPCCVYSKSFKDRCLADGTPVKTHADLCNWICELDPVNIKRSTLDIEGKNELIYFLGVGEKREIG